MFLFITILGEHGNDWYTFTISILERIYISTRLQAQPICWVILAYQITERKHWPCYYRPVLMQGDNKLSSKKSILLYEWLFCVNQKKNTLIFRCDTNLDWKSNFLELRLIRIMAILFFYSLANSFILILNTTLWYIFLDENVNEDQQKWGYNPWKAWIKKRAQVSYNII